MNSMDEPCTPPIKELIQSTPTEVDVGVNTSPGQLQDVTMDNSYALGYRSPCISFQHAGNTSPGQGRSVREFEEQMASLRKENFNLKLRIYFLEEKIPGYSSANPDGHESLLKQNVDLKVEVELLRKELQEKQSVLGEAAKALELMEQQQKTIDELNEKIQFLEMENKQLEKSTDHHEMEEIIGRTDIIGDIDTIQKISELEDCVKHYSDTNEELTAKIEELRKILSEKDEKIATLEENIKQMIFQTSELEEQLDIKRRELANSERNMQIHQEILEDNDEKYNDLISENQGLLMTIEKLQDELEYEKINFDNCRKKFERQKRHIEDMLRACRLREELQEYKKEIADKTCLLQETEEKLKEKTTANENACKVIQKLVAKTQELQCEIDNLKKKNCLPNVTEIKENTYGNNSTALSKNFTDSLEDTNNIKLNEIIEEKNSEIKKLKIDLKKKRSNLLTLVNEEILLKNQQIENLTNLLKKLDPTTIFSPSSPTRDGLQLQLFTESDLEESINYRKHLQKKIDILIHRLLNLPELTTVENTYQLKIDLNNAKDETEKAYRWGKEACLVLTERLEELAGFLDSLLKHKDILETLAADRSREMRKAIDRSLDISRSVNMSLSVTGMSISEHSLAQLSNITGLLDMSVDLNKENKSINIHNKIEKDQTYLIENLQSEIKSLKKELNHRKLSDSMRKERRSLPLNFENQTDSEAWSEPDRNVSLARMGLEKSPGFNRCRKSTEEEKPSTSSESDISRKGKIKTQEKIIQLENMISLRDNQILEVQCELMDADNRLKQENHRITEINHKLEEYQRNNEILKIEIENYRSQIEQYEKRFSNEQQNAKHILSEKITLIEQTREERDKLNVEVQVAEMKIETLKKDIDELKEKYEQMLEKTIEQEKQKIEQLQTQMSAQLEQKLQEQEDKHREYLARDWISRILYDEIKCDLEIAQRNFNEAKNTIEFLQENESELNKRLIDNEKATRNLKNKLDEATLQASKTVLERTKIQAEKLELEKKIQNLMEKLQLVELERSEVNAKLIQLEKSTITMLPENNLKSNNSVHFPSHHQYKQCKKTSSHGSDASQSGYTSEDVPNAPSQAGAQRLENSSPDLGIESDAGRASSVELAGVQNRLLKSIENIGSVGNILEEGSFNLQDKMIDGNNVIDDNILNKTGPITHDCLKAEKEIVELRRKLARTKRALEDTYKKLRTSNQRKEQIERDIRQQIVKTHNVLKNVRTNMESKLEVVGPNKND